MRYLGFWALLVTLLGVIGYGIFWAVDYIASDGDVLWGGDVP